MNFKMVHMNFNVKNIEESMEFYAKALNLKEKRRIEGEGFTIVYLGEEESDFLLELTALDEHPQAYNLGENEFHLAFMVEDFDGAYQKHKEMGCICYENKAMGIYFILDPDGYWLEVVPKK